RAERRRAPIRRNAGGRDQAGGDAKRGRGGFGNLAASRWRHAAGQRCAARDRCSAAGAAGAGHGKRFCAHGAGVRLGEVHGQDRGRRMSHEDIEATKAPLLEHLIELRSRLIKAVLAFAVMFALCFVFARDIYNVLVWPFVWVAGSENSKFIYTALLEYFVTQLKLAMFGA